jgi:hypothetical protein
VILSFGKYKDWDLAEVPDDYVDYMVGQKRKDLQLWEDEQKRRELMREADLPWVEQLIKAGHHALAQKHHPDRGGSAEEMQAINAAAAQLKDFVVAQRTSAYP